MYYLCRSFLSQERFLAFLVEWWIVSILKAKQIKETKFNQSRHQKSNEMKKIKSKCTNHLWIRKNCDIRFRFDVSFRLKHIQARTYCLVLVVVVVAANAIAVAAAAAGWCCRHVMSFVYSVDAMTNSLRRCCNARLSENFYFVKLYLWDFFGFIWMVCRKLWTSYRFR